MGTNAPGRLPRQSKLVVVIGAGFAGLAAAKAITRLTSGEVQVMVLEASNRVGGRAWTREFDFGAVEMGATWFHGTEGHPLFELAVKEGIFSEQDMQRAGLKSGKQDEGAEQQPGAAVGTGTADAGEAAGEDEHESCSWFSNFDMAGSATSLSGKEKQIAQDAFRHYSAALKALETLQVDGISAVGDFIRTKFQEAVSGQGLQGRELDVFAAAWKNRELLQRAIDGYFSTDDVSVAHVKAYSDLPGPLIPVPGGYQALARLLARDLDVQLDWQVANLDWDGTPGAAVRVRSTDGREVEADAVIVTVSLGVLQANHKRLFNPNLPASKVHAMESIRLGVVDKIFLQLIPPQPAKLQPPVSTCSFPKAIPPGQISASPTPRSDAAVTANAITAITIPDIPVASPTNATNVASMHESQEEEEDGEHAVSLEVQASALLWPAGAEELGPKLVHPFITGPIANGQEVSEGHCKPPYDTKDASCSANTGEPGEFYLTGVSELLYGNTFRYVFPGASTSATYPDGTPRQDFLGSAWITSYPALQMETLSDEQFHSSMRQLIRSFPALPVPEGAQLKAYMTRWGRDPLFYGSYSYICTGADGAAVEELGQPLSQQDGQPVVCFAGEATHPNYMGTTHGAYMSGEREAKRLLKSWGYAVDVAQAEAN